MQIYRVSTAAVELNRFSSAKVGVTKTSESPEEEEELNGTKC